MPHGINHAKQIVIGEATELARKLQNGDAGCVKTQGRAIALLVKMITPLYEADFVTVEDCGQMHKGRSGKITKIKIGPIVFEGPISTALLINTIPLLCCVVVVFMAGKLQNWW